MNTAARALQPLAAVRRACGGGWRWYAESGLRRGFASAFAVVGRLLHRLLRRPGRLALGALLLHLHHRGALVVEAELPGPAAEGLDRQPRRLAADRAALLEPPEVVSAPGQRPETWQESGASGSSRFQPSQPYIRLPPFELDDPQPVRGAVLAACGRPPRRPCRARGTCPRPSPPRRPWRGPRGSPRSRWWSCAAARGCRRRRSPWSSRRRRSGPSPPRAGRSSPGSPSPARSCLNASYIAIPVSEGIGGLA